MHINIYMLLKCACVLDFLKLAGMRAYPRVCGYPRIAGTGIIFYPLRVAGAGEGADFSTRVRVYEVDIRVDFTRCHPYPHPKPFFVLSLSPIHVLIQFIHKKYFISILNTDCTVVF